MIELPILRAIPFGALFTPPVIASEMNENADSMELPRHIVQLALEGTRVKYHCNYSADSMTVETSQFGDDDIGYEHVPLMVSGTDNLKK